MKFKFSAISLCLAAGVLTAPLAAQSNSEPAAASVMVKKNKILVDANGRRLGKIFEVNPGKGYASFILQMKTYRVPLKTITSDGNHLVTSMSKEELGL